MSKSPPDYPAIRQDPKFHNLYTRTFDALRELDREYARRIKAFRERDKSLDDPHKAPKPPNDLRNIACVSQKLFPERPLPAYKYVHAILLTLKKHDVLEDITMPECGRNLHYAFTENADRDVAMKLDYEFPDVQLFHGFAETAEKIKLMEIKLNKVPGADGPSRG